MVRSARLRRESGTAGKKPRHPRPRTAAAGSNQAAGQKGSFRRPAVYTIAEAARSTARLLVCWETGSASLGRTIKHFTKLSPGQAVDCQNERNSVLLVVPPAP